MNGSKNNLKISDKYKLEKKLTADCIDIDSLSNAELNYVKRAIKISYPMLKKFMYLYDESKPKIDESLFIEFLCGIFSASKEEIIFRIKEVRLVSKIETEIAIKKLREGLKSTERLINIGIDTDESRK